MMKIFYWLYVLLMVGWASGLLWRMWRGWGLVTVWHLYTVFSLALSGSPTWWTSLGKMELSCLCKFFFTLKRNPVSVVEPRNLYIKKFLCCKGFELFNLSSMNEASVQLEAMCRVNYFISNLVNWGTALGKFHLHRSRVCWGDQCPSTLFLPTKHDASRLILKNGMPLKPPPPPHTPQTEVYIYTK